MIESTHARTRGSKNDQPNYLRRRLAVGSILGALGATALMVGINPVARSIFGDHQPKTPTLHEEHVVGPGDTMEGIAAQFKKSSEGMIKIPLTDIEKHLHTQFNPDARTVQDPHDDILQPGEKVVGDVPFNQPHK